jgi:hypothetical protein
MSSHIRLLPVRGWQEELGQRLPSRADKVLRRHEEFGV